jgi:hypothetical protein
MTPVKFRDLVEEKYIDAGFSKEQTLSKLYVETGISRSSLRAAFNGTRISPENTDRLEAWAARVHKVELDTKALMAAPAAAGRKPRLCAACQRSLEGGNPC